MTLKSSTPRSMQTGQNSIAPENSLPQLGQVRWGSVLIFLTTSPRPQPKASPRSAERCELGQHSSWRTVFPVARAIESCAYTSASNRISEHISCGSRPVAPAAARSTPGMFRSEVRSEEEDVFVRGCLRRRYLPAQSPGIKVADFLAVRPEHRGNDDGTLVEPERAGFNER